MKHIRCWLYIAGCLVLSAAVFTGCKKNYYDAGSTEEVSSGHKQQLLFDTESCELEIGMSGYLTVTGWGYSSKPEIIYTSVDSSIASVDSSGLVTAKAAGETMIVAETTQQGFLPAECRIVVTPVKKAVIEDDIPAVSAQNKSYSINIKFENCSQPSVRIIADCGEMTVESSGGTNQYKAELVEIRTSGQTQIQLTTANKTKNSIRILCYNDSEVIDVKEYIIYNEGVVKDYLRKNIAGYVDGQIEAKLQKMR